VRCATAGQVGVSQVTGTFRALRSRALISSTDQELVKVALPTRGRLGVGQGGRQCLVGSDGLVVYDTARPYEVRFGDTCEVVVLGIPRALLGPHAGRLAHRTACAIPIDVGGQRFAAALLRSAASELDTLSGDSSPYLADALISLVLSAISGRPAGGPGQELAGRVFTYCLAHLSDPWLSPGAVAREHGVSVRHLNRSGRSFPRSSQRGAGRRGLGHPGCHSPQPCPARGVRAERGPDPAVRTCEHRLTRRPSYRDNWASDVWVIAGLTIMRVRKHRVPADA
jgi:hypothetical protein